MGIILSDHAKDRMRERGILAKEIKAVLANPKKEIFEKNRHVCYSIVNRKNIIVVYKNLKNKVLIITTYEGKI